MSILSALSNLFGSPADKPVATPTFGDTTRISATVRELKDAADVERLAQMIHSRRFYFDELHRRQYKTSPISQADQLEMDRRHNFERLAQTGATSHRLGLFSPEGPLWAFGENKDIDGGSLINFECVNLGDIVIEDDRYRKNHSALEQTFIDSLPELARKTLKGAHRKAIAIIPTMGRSHYPFCTAENLRPMERLTTLLIREHNFAINRFPKVEETTIELVRR